MSDERLSDGERWVEVVDRMALVGVHPRPIPQETMLRALLQQNGHYVASEVVDLMDVAGVAPMSGIVILVPAVHPEVTEPGFIRRELGEHAGLFYDEQARSEPGVLRSKKPWKTHVPEESVLRACSRACARWELPKTAGGRAIDDYNGGTTADFAWGNSTRLGTGKWNHEEIWPSAALHHAWLYAIGSEPGIIALTAGRLEEAGCTPLAIVGARWMFDLV